MKTIVNADCYDYMKEIKDNTIDLCVTDPPYILNNDGGGKSSIHSIKKISKGLKDMENGFDSLRWFKEMQRIMKKVNCFIFCSNKQLTEIMMLGEKNKYYTTCLIWNKYNCTPFSNGVWCPDIEFIVHIREKGATFKGGADIKKKVNTLPIEVSKYNHPTEKPIKLYMKFLEIGSSKNDIIIDTFSGSGTLAEASEIMDRQYICIEKKKKHYDSSIKRLKNFTDQLRMDL